MQTCCLCEAILHAQTQETCTILQDYSTGKEGSTKSSSIPLHPIDPIKPSEEDLTTYHQEWDSYYSYYDYDTYDTTTNPLDPVCRGPYERRVACGPCREPTCGNPTADESCTQCHLRCHCHDGFIRSSASVNATCIPASACSANSSRKTCQELGLNPTLYGSPLVCARSDIGTENDRCPDLMDYPSAQSACLGVGMRLCTKVELLSDESRRSGCQGDMKRVWSSSTEGCDVGETVTLAGSSAFLYIVNQRCTEKLNSKLTVRCCADTAVRRFSDDTKTIAPPTSESWPGVFSVLQPFGATAATPAISSLKKHED